MFNESEATAIVTKHASKRMRERIGINKKSVLKQAEFALEKGISHKDTTGQLKKFLDDLFLKENVANNMKIYNHKIFLFKENILITVINLPNMFCSRIKKIEKRKNKK